MNKYYHNNDDMYVISFCACILVGMILDYMVVVECNQLIMNDRVTC